MAEHPGETDSHKDLIRRWIAVFNTGDATDADAIVAEAFVEHAIAPFGREAPGSVEGPRHLREAAAWLLAQFPDLHMAAEAIAADDDLVAVLVASTGTNLGPLNEAIPPTGRTFAGRQSHWFRVSGGRLAEHWATRDDLGAMLQLGVIPLPGSRAPR